MLIDDCEDLDDEFVEIDYVLENSVELENDDEHTWCSTCGEYSVAYCSEFDVYVCMNDCETFPPD